MSQQNHETDMQLNHFASLHDNPALYEFNDDRYRPPTPQDITRVINYMGLSSAKLAQQLGVSDGRTIRRWKSGQVAMPYAVWRLLLAKAGMVEIGRL